MDQILHSYLGSKAASGAYQAIISQMPPHDTYIEPFLGTGTVMLRKPRAQLHVGFDLCLQCVDHVRSMLDKGNQVPGNKVRLEQRDSLTWLRYRKDAHDWPAEWGRVLIYCDPPYLWSTRSSSHRYKHEFDDTDHQELLRILQTLVTRFPGTMVMVSGYPSADYDSWLPSWRSIEFQVMTRGGVRTEKLWMSFPPGAVHWHDYAGSDFTDRQRIKRKAARWARNYEGLPPGERLALLSSILQVGC